MPLLPAANQSSAILVPASWLRPLSWIGLLIGGATTPAPSLIAADRPNILWVIAEDASPHIGPYGERTIATPNLAQLAREGITFQRAFVTAPVCSPSRSALVSGVNQTTLGSHNHQSGNAEPGVGGARVFYDSYRVPEGIRLIPELFADAGYYVTNMGYGGSEAKTDYNFEPRGKLYEGEEWAARAPGQPFFSQIHLRGGKDRAVKTGPPVDPATVSVPPYYPDHPVFRKDWAEYLDSWVKTDAELGDVLSQLKEEGVLESTVVFFLTDHGVAHLRGKQFLYDEGIHIPLIVRMPGAQAAGTVRHDLVNQIDVAAASLHLAGIPIPPYVQGRPLFAVNHQPRSAVFSTRDRCDETVDLQRSVRTEHYKYIRNFMSYVPHAQANRYKDGKGIMQLARRLHSAGQLDPVQAQIFVVPRPVDELYDLINDPHETVNLAEQPEFQAVRAELKVTLYAWMVEDRDLGVIPEPILDEMGMQAGSKYAALRAPQSPALITDIIATIEAGERKDTTALQQSLTHPHAAVRYWATVWLGRHGESSARRQLAERLGDEAGAVRVAAAEALYAFGETQLAAAALKQALSHPHHSVAFYAVRAWESIGAPAADILPLISRSPHATYDYIERIRNRLAQSSSEPALLRAIQNLNP
jgi:arylsulfatase A-like enzyme